MKDIFFKANICMTLILLMFAEIALGQQVDNKYPPKYSGDNLAKVIDKMKKLGGKAVKKGEFETTEQYTSRVESIIEANKNEKNLVFIFRPRNSEIEYDADKRKMSISIKNYDYDDNYENFILKDTRKITGSSLATNGFGAKVRITKVDQNLIKLKHNAEEKYKDSGISSYKLSMDSINVITSPEMAKKIKSNIAVSYTAFPVPHYYEFEKNHHKPSYRDPREVYLKEQTLYVEFKQIAIFNYSTGEIYGELNINERVDNIVNKYNDCKTTRQSYECRDLLDEPILELEI